MIGYVLFFVGLLTAFILYPIGIVYGALKMSLLYVGAILKTFAVGLSQFGNVACSELFNDTLIKKDGVKFGSPDNTTSKILGINKRNGTLTKTGLFFADLLNKIDPNHVENAADK
jgi:hypothetical protein